MNNNVKFNLIQLIIFNKLTFQLFLFNIKEILTYKFIFLYSAQYVLHMIIIENIF